MTFAEQLNAYLAALGCTAKQFAAACGMAPSSISRYRAGERVPAPGAPELAKLAGGVTALAAERGVAELADAAVVAEALERAVLEASGPGAGDAGAQAGQATAPSVGGSASGAAREQDEEAAVRFLLALSRADLTTYLQAVRYDELRTPAAAMAVAATKRYRGIEQLREAHLDFLRLAAAARGTHELLLYSDLPQAQLAEDPAFNTRWMLGLLTALKAGRRISWIHDLSAPFPQMVQGLEGLIPLYLTGQVDPYALDGAQPGVFRHLLFACETSALEGSCLDGWVAEGSYALVRRGSELEGLRQRGARMLELASRPLRAYRDEAARACGDQLAAYEQLAPAVCAVRCAPPLATIPYDVLEAMLARATLSDAQKAELRDAARRAYLGLVALVERGQVSDTLVGITEQGESPAPVRLVVPELPYDLRLSYEPAELVTHVAATRFFAREHRGYQLRFRPERPFGDMDVIAYPGVAAVAVKHTGPRATVAVEHPRLRDAIAALVRKA